MEKDRQYVLNNEELISSSIYLYVLRFFLFYYIVVGLVLHSNQPVKWADKLSPQRHRGEDNMSAHYPKVEALGKEVLLSV